MKGKAIIQFFIKAIFASLEAGQEIGWLIHDAKTAQQAKSLRRQAKRKPSIENEDIPSANQSTSSSQPNPLFLATLLIMLLCGLWVEWRGGA